MNDETALAILDRQRFLCQNAYTGEMMPNPWTLRQLCRILCPPLSNNPTGQHSTTTLISGTSTTTVSQYSQLLAIEADGTYATEGWKPVKDCAVLKEAVALWYYEVGINQEIPSSSCSNISMEKTVEGPLSCRALAILLDQSKYPSNEETRVYSDVTGVWDSLSKFPNLQLALKAFQTNQNSYTVPTSLFSEDSVNATEMIFPSYIENSGDDVKNIATMNEVSKDAIRDEREAFLSSTARGLTDDNDGGEESYHSDGGTRFSKDVQTGEWVRQDGQHPVRKAVATVDKETNSSKHETLKTEKNAVAAVNGNVKKRKRPKFSSKHAKCWIYVTGLPNDCTVDELKQVFSKAGIIGLDPETQLPKIKIYRHKDGPKQGLAKGDASICYARPESVELATTLLDDTPLRPSPVDNGHGADGAMKMSVKQAKFEQHGDSFDVSKGPQRVSKVKRQVAKLAAIQATDWDEGEVNGRISGGRKGLRIIVIKHLFDPIMETMDDAKLQQIEEELTSECAKFGDVEKITLFEKNPNGVVIVKFTKPGAASEAVRALDGREWKNNSNPPTRVLRVSYWDGVTDFTVQENEEKELIQMEKRQEEFGEWLEKQELPEELRLKNATAADEEDG